MFTNRWQRLLPKKAILGLAVLGLTLAAGGASAKQASAGPTTPYTMEVSWNRVKWSEIDDGFANLDFELYGTLHATNLNNGSGGVRMIGDTGNPGRCSSGTWDGSGPCTKEVGTGLSYYFKDTPLSASTATGQGGINYAYNNNKVYVTMRPGDTLRLSARLYDYDATSGNDNACVGTINLTLSEAQLKGQDWTSPGIQYEDGDAKCFVEFRLRQV